MFGQLLAHCVCVHMHASTFVFVFTSKQSKYILRAIEISMGVMSGWVRAVFFFDKKERAPNNAALQHDFMRSTIEKP